MRGERDDGRGRELRAIYFSNGKRKDRREIQFVLYLDYLEDYLVRISF